jgi:hypothetical protein
MGNMVRNLDQAAEPGSKDNARWKGQEMSREKVSIVFGVLFRKITKQHSIEYYYIYNSHNSIDFESLAPSGQMGPP